MKDNLKSRHSKLAACFFVLHGIGTWFLGINPNVCFATDPLYTITQDGVLVVLDKATAEAAQVREQLSADYRGIQGLEYFGGYFYASYNGLTSQSARIVRFGFVAGDEVVIGNFSPSNNRPIRGLGARPGNSSAIYASLNYTSGAPNNVQILNLTNISSTLQSGDGGTNGAIQYIDDITGVSFKDENTEYLLSLNYDYLPAVNVVMGKLLFSSSQWNVSYVQFMSGQTGLPNTSSGMAFDPSSTSTLYVVTGIGSNSQVTDSQLYSVTDTGTSFSRSLVGDVDGFQGLAGAAFGPVDPCSDSEVPLSIYLQNQTLTSTVSYNAGVLIAAGSNVSSSQSQGDYVVSGTGDLTLISGGHISLASGFKVQAGGKLSARIDTSVCSL